MALIPLPKGFAAVDGLPKQRETLFNLMYSNGLISRPGVTGVGSQSGACRGQFMFNGLLHQVIGTTLYSIASDGAVTGIGTISGTADVVAAVDHAATALIVKGGDGYVLTSTLAQITDSDFVPSDDVTVIDGIFVYIPSDGGPAFFSGVGTPGVIDPLAFFDAETSPDLNRGVAEINNDLIILGGDTFEAFRHVGTDAAPFLRVLGATYKYGYFGGRVKYRIGGVELLCFIGRDEGGGFGIFSTQGRISNPAIDELLQEYSEAELLSATASRFTWNGIDALAFCMARHTLVTDGTLWWFFGSGFDGSPWKVKFITFAYGKFYVGTTDGQIGYLADVDDDFDEKIDRYLDTFYRTGPQQNVTLANLEAQITFRRTAGTLGLSLSQDGIFYGTTFWRDTPAAGKYTQRIVFDFPGGLGCFSEFAGIRLRSTERITYNTDALFVDDGT